MKHAVIKIRCSLFYVLYIYEVLALMLFASPELVEVEYNRKASLPKMFSFPV